MRKNNWIILIIITVSLSLSCQTKFDKKVWLENNDDLLKTDNPRIYMVDDVLNNYLKIGMDKEDVINILGKPSKDTIGVYLPKNSKFPDSLSMIGKSNLSEEKKEEYLHLSNQWYKNNYKSAPMLTYYVGWSTMDPVFLEIILNKNNKVVDFWRKQN